MTGKSAHDSNGNVIPRNVYISGLGWCWVKPLEYGDVIAYEQRPRSEHSLSWLFEKTLCGFSPEPERIANMRFDVPQRLERAILEASEVIDEGEPQSEDTQEQDFREDSPFAQAKGKQDKQEENTIEDTIQWLHEQGYLYKELYQLLIGELEALSEGYRRKKEREKEHSEPNQSSSSAPTSHGNRGDRAKELGWR